MEFFRTCFHRVAFILIGLFLGLGVASPAFASWEGWNVEPSWVELYGVTEVQLLHVTSDAMDGYADLKLTLDQDFSILGFRYITSKGVVQEFKLSDLDAGVVLYKSSGKDVLKIIVNNGSRSVGGAINLVYLSNGIFDSYGTFSMNLERKGNVWVLEVNDNAGRREFTSMYLAANKFFGKVIGIDSITVK